MLDGAIHWGDNVRNFFPRCLGQGSRRSILVNRESWLWALRCRGLICSLKSVLLALGLDGSRLPHDVVDLPHNGLLKMLRRLGLTQLQAGLLSLKEKLQVLLHFLQLKLVVHYVHILGAGRSRGALMLTRHHVLGWRQRWGWLLRGWRWWGWQLLLWLLLKVTELQLLVVAKLDLDRGCL